jgi:uncharacterized membrane protein HdeD (DUF308 family)
MAKKEKAEKAKQSTYRNLSENWKTVVAQGAIALVLGVIMVAVPSLTAKVVSILLGALIIVYGILSFVSARSAGKESQPTTWLYVRACVAVAGGIVILAWPGLQSLTLLYVLAVFSIAVGAFVMLSGLFQKWDSMYKAVAGIGGLLSIVFGIILISARSGLTDSIVWITGAYAIAFGVLLIILGLGARGIVKTDQ